jgi:tetratricopeptide (TPR) repeat protein
VTSCLFAVCLVAAAWADDGLLARMAHLATHYHEDPSRLDAAVREMERAVAADPTPPRLAMLARITYVRADVRAPTREERLAAYERARETAERALARDPDNVDARYWRAVNVGRSIQLTGGIKAAVKGLSFSFVDEMTAILERQPGYVSAYAFLGAYYHALPWPLGSVDKAVAMYARAVTLDPHGTQQRVGLAKALIDKKKPAEAREHLLRVLDEKTPSNPAEWTLKDRPEARALLDTLTR